MTSSHVSDLVRRIRDLEPRTGDVTVVAIDGPAGSGKTTLAAELADRLDCLVIHMDDIYPGWDGLERAAQDAADLVLRPLTAGKPARYRQWDWERDEFSDWVDVPAAALIIVEGCGSGSFASAPYLSLLIWADAPLDVRKKRALARDGDAFRPHWERWARQEEAHFAENDTRARADVDLAL